MQTKKIRDILPPRRVEKEHIEEKDIEPESSQRQRTTRGFKGVLAGAFFLVLVGGVTGALVLHFIFARAQVSIWPNTREVSTQERILALGGERAQDVATKRIPSLTISEEKKITRLFPATGKAIEKKKAQGLIRVFNGFSAFPQKLVANTRFLSEEGKLFRSQNSVVVPGGRQEGGKFIAGSLDIQVIAAEAGEEYNIGPSNFSLPGLFGNPAYTSIYGQSSQPILGGLQEEISIVTESDLNMARDAVVEELQQNLRESLQTRALLENMVLLSEAIALEVKEASSPVKPGARIDSFNFSAKVQGFAVTFSKTDIENVAKAQVRDFMKEHEKLSAETLQISYENIEMNTSSQDLSFDAKVSALLYEEIDLTDLKARLAGVSKKDAVVLLSQHTALKKAEILFFPFWLTHFPKDSHNVHITLVIDPVVNVGPAWQNK